MGREEERAVVLENRQGKGEIFLCLLNYSHNTHESEPLFKCLGHC